MTVTYLLCLSIINGKNICSWIHVCIRYVSWISGLNLSSVQHAVLITRFYVLHFIAINFNMQYDDICFLILWFTLYVNMCMLLNCTTVLLIYLIWLDMYAPQCSALVQLICMLFTLIWCSITIFSLVHCSHSFSICAIVMY